MTDPTPPDKAAPHHGHLPEWMKKPGMSSGLILVAVGGLLGYQENSGTKATTQTLEGISTKIEVFKVQQENTAKELEETKKEFNDRLNYILQRLDSLDISSRGGSNQNNNRINIGGQDELPAFLTPRELAEQLDDHEDTVRQRIRDGEIPAQYVTKKGRYYLISSDYLNNL